MLVTYVVFTLVWQKLLDTRQCIAQNQFNSIQYNNTIVLGRPQQLNVKTFERPWNSLTNIYEGERGPAAGQKWLGFCLRDIPVKHVSYILVGLVNIWVGWLGESGVNSQRYNWFNCRVLACTSLTLATLKLNTSDTSLFLATLVPAQASAAYYRNCKWPYRLKIQ